MFVIKDPEQLTAEENSSVVYQAITNKVPGRLLRCYCPTAKSPTDGWVVVWRDLQSATWASYFDRQGNLTDIQQMILPAGLS